MLCGVVLLCCCCGVLLCGRGGGGGRSNKSLMSSTQVGWRITNFYHYKFDDTLFSNNLFFLMEERVFGDPHAYC